MKSFKLFSSVFLLALFSLISGGVCGQTWIYDFGTSTGTFSSSTASTSFLPSPTSGTSRVRVGTNPVGTNPGSFKLVNPGISLGVNSELQMTSNTGSTSTTKFSIHDYTASKSGFVKFKIAFSGGSNGVYNFTLGDGTSFSDNNAMVTSQVFSGIQWSLLPSNAVTFRVLNHDTYGITGISNSTSLFTQSTSNEYLVEIYYNNTNSSLNYNTAGTSYSIANAKWDLWINGTLIGDDLSKGAKATDSNIDSYAFNHQASATAPGTIYIDDIEYFNALPTAPSASAPTLTAAVGATVDNPFNITFTEDATWRNAITGITVGGAALSSGAFSTATSGQITLTPSSSVLLQSSGDKTIIISAAGYSSATVTQSISPGLANKLALTTQPTAPATNGGSLTIQPVVVIQDQYGNATSSNATVSATVGNGSWTLGGTTAQNGVSGVVTYTNLSATSLIPVTGATIQFNSQGLTGVTSNSFNIAAPVPTALPATNFGCTSFTANWSAVAGASSYNLDVFPLSSLPTDLFFSEYVEGSSNNKYLEIYNGTPNSIDLSDYQLRLFANGAASPPSATNTLTGILPSGAVVVYKNSGATIYTGSAQTYSSTNYNGNDAIALYKISTLSYVDIIGSIGHDPVSAWDSGSHSTLDKTLVRKSSVSSGITTNPSSTFPSLTTEWDVYNINDISNLGTHNFSITYVSNFQNVTVNNTSQVVSGLTSGVSYCYLVRASFGQDNSSNSNQIIASPYQQGTWIGSPQGNWNDNNNWCGGIPNGNMNAIIPSGNTVDLNVPNEVSLVNLTNSGTLNILSNKKLTLTGNLTNNGTLTLEDGATLVQGAGSGYSGSGTVQVKQNVTGGNSGNSPNGRFWYMGSPVAGGLSSILDAAGANVVKYWDEPSAAWLEITDNTTALSVGRGHYLRSVTPGLHTLTFTGGALNNDTYPLPLTANGASFNGFNLVSNPYPSYLKWDDVARTNVGSTVWYRTSNGTNNMVFDTYNSNGNLGTSNNGASVSQYIPPMQAFWVRVEGSATGNIVMENADRSHHVSGAQGMFRTTDKQMFASINLIKDSLRDEVIVYSSHSTSDVFDAFDSEKMFQANMPQLYSKVNNKKLVIQAKKFMQRNEKTPLYMHAHVAGTYQLQLGEYHNSFGSIWLEDLSNGQFQNLVINDTYTFETAATQDSARFVLHFGYPEQIYGTEAFDNSDQQIAVPMIWNDVSVVAVHDKIIDLTANLNEIDALQIKTVSVFDMTGRQVMSGTFENGNNEIQVPAANAVYMVHVSVGSAYKVFKVLIQE